MIMARSDSNYVSILQRDSVYAKGALIARSIAIELENDLCSQKKTHTNIGTRKADQNLHDAIKETIYVSKFVFEGL